MVFPRVLVVYHCVLYSLIASSFSLIHTKRFSFSVEELLYCIFISLMCYKRFFSAILYCFIVAPVRGRENSINALQEMQILVYVLSNHN